MKVFQCKGCGKEFIGSDESETPEWCPVCDDREADYPGDKGREKKKPKEVTATGN